MTLPSVRLIISFFLVFTVWQQDKLQENLHRHFPPSSQSFNSLNPHNTFPSYRLLSLIFGLHLLSLLWVFSCLYS
ncbi:hypothetical protein PPACK8108_LOCUS4148 [Phakopsora pachyrhizi]|uniref:Uncharacterized protein n=1 Tax=Phakopsora pachyrhizi TaxID=170000 RepID=A0AAV0ANK4_PHAPC|nr:hypothetical protein PPACK8108_LOCUS4148 [Phakopsora pachyrhizi]